MKPILNLKKVALDKDKFQSIQDWINEISTYQVPVILKDQATVNWDISKAYNAELTLGASRTLNVQSVQPGDYGTIVIIQGGTGSYTLTLPAGSKVAGAGAGALTLSTAVGSRDIATFYYDGTYFNWTLSTDFT
jgi:hypothetical protein